MGDLVRLVVEARMLATDERSRRTFEVRAPLEAGELRAEMERLVAHVHPRARLRAFADDQATFADHRLTIVAYCLAAGPASGDEAAIGQDRLFAA